METDVHALQEALDMIADAAHDYITSKNSGSQGLSAYGNLLPDIFALVPDIGKIPAEIKSMTAEDGLHLVSELAKRVGVTDVHAEAVLDAALKVLSDLVTIMIPDAEALYTAIKTAKA